MTSTTPRHFKRCLLLGLLLQLSATLRVCHGEGDRSWLVTNVHSKSDLWMLGSGGLLGGQPKVTDEKAQAMFADWMEYHNKTYGNKMQKNLALGRFKKNMQAVADINGNAAIPFWASGNQFSALSWDEYSSQVLMAPQVVPPDDSSLSPPSPSWVRGLQALPSQKNWIAEGMATPTRNQGGVCASCWAFSAATAMESAYLIAYPGTAPGSVRLSQQQLVDCTNRFNGPYNSQGCQGGWPHEAMNYAAMSNLTTVDSYPYTAVTSACNKAAVLGALQAVKLAYGAQRVIPSNNEAAIMQAVTLSPVVVGFAVDPTFQFYSGGLYTPGTCSTYMNHALVVMGYDTTDPTNRYWILRNSWGNGWGEGGNVRISMTGNTLGPCGMYQYAYKPPLSFSQGLSTTSSPSPATSPSPPSPSAQLPPPSLSPPPPLPASPPPLPSISPPLPLSPSPPPNSPPPAPAPPGPLSPPPPTPPSPIDSSPPPSPLPPSPPTTFSPPPSPPSSPPPTPQPSPAPLPPPPSPHPSSPPPNRSPPPPSPSPSVTTLTSPSPPPLPNPDQSPMLPPPPAPAPPLPLPSLSPPPVPRASPSDANFLLPPPPFFSPPPPRSASPPPPSPPPPLPPRGRFSPPLPRFKPPSPKRFGNRK